MDLPVPEGKDAVKRVRVSVRHDVEVSVEKRLDGLFYATAPYCRRDKNGVVTVRSAAEDEAVAGCLTAAGYKPDTEE